MGICLSTQIKAESLAHTDTVGNHVGNSNGDGNFEAHTQVQGEILQSCNLKKFEFSDLTMATRNFRPDSVVGEGRFGSVFKGWIDEHSYTAAKPGSAMVIAVRKLPQQSFHGHGDWLEEVNYLGQFSHPHLVKLIGYCLEDEHRVLVYEFVPRGSLENHLFMRGSYFQHLSWNLRLKVALGAAKGLAFLHSAATTKVIYRDFKTSNILLDSNYTAKLSDFGLANVGPSGDKSCASTRVMGTYGYAAPEYLATGRSTTKSVVYSYGVVLLEMLSGRRAIDKNRPSGQQKLVEWAKLHLANNRKLFHVLDNRLEGQYTMDVAHRVANLALQCISTEPKLRPTMKEIVKELEQLQDIKNVGKTRSSSSKGPRQCRQSANDAGNKDTNDAYTRPSASPIHSK